MREREEAGRIREQVFKNPPIIFPWRVDNKGICISLILDQRLI